MRFILKKLTTDMPVQVTLVSTDAGKDLKLEVFKGTWNNLLLSGSTKEKGGPVSFRFRTAEDACFVVSGPSLSTYQMMVWVGPEMKAQPPQPFVTYEEYARLKPTAFSPAPIAAAESSSRPQAVEAGSGSPFIVVLLVGILGVLATIAFLLLRRQRVAANLLLVGVILGAGALAGGASLPQDDLAPLPVTKEKLDPSLRKPFDALVQALKAYSSASGDLLPGEDLTKINDLLGKSAGSMAKNLGLGLNLLEQFGYIDRREAAVQPNFNPPGMPPLPSTWQI